LRLLPYVSASLKSAHDTTAAHKMQAGEKNAGFDTFSVDKKRRTEYNNNE